MLAVLAPIARTVIMALTTGAAITAVQEVVDGTFGKLVDAIRDEHGLTTDEAQDIFSNILIDLAINSVTIGGVLRTKLAVRTAERLGFTSKGFSKRALSPKAAEAVKKMDGPWEKFKSTSLLKKILTVAAIPGSFVWLAKALADIVEPGIYQTKQTNALYRKLGIPFQYPETATGLSPGNMDSTRFNDYARSLEVAGIKGINNPVAQQTQFYSREALADVIDYVYGQEILKGTKLNDYRSLIPLIAPYLIGATSTPSPSFTPPKPSTSNISTPTTKVFTGVVSQGTVGAGLIFTPRPDDIIESLGELQEAINNNVAPYLAALLSKVTYEVRVVSSVIVNGIKQIGQAHQIVSGHYANGSPKYKTVVNKFAVVDLYLVKDSDSRTKLTSIVLGPTDAIRFQPGKETLLGLSQVVSKNLITTNTNDIDIIVSDTPTTPKTPEEAAAAAPPTPDPDQDESEEERQRLIKLRDDLQKQVDELVKQQSSNSSSSKSEPKSEPEPSKSSSSKKASTLSEYYAQKGKSLPSLSVRAELYESYKLGKASMYTGTAEQNTKLLKALQR